MSPPFLSSGETISYARPLGCGGVASVVSTWSALSVSPAGLDATRRKWYSVFGWRPVIAFETATLLAPEPALSTGVVLP
jgi:hypothetical protein